MKKHKFDESSFIKGYYTSPSVCNKLINYFKKNPDQHCKGLMGYSHENKEDKDKKESTELVNSPNDFFNLFEDYGSHLDNSLKDYLESYSHANRSFRFEIIENIKIQYYKPKQGFKSWHFENNGCSKSRRRHLVFMTYLNDVDNGGTEFYYQGITSPAKKGLTLIWPSAWTHTHRGQISPDKEKYIATGWYSFVE